VKKPSIQTNEGSELKRVEIISDILTNPDSTYPITIKPYKFNISQFGERERKKLNFKITNVSDENVEVKLVDMPEGMFKLDLPKKIKAGKTEDGSIEILDGYVSQEFKKSITIQLNDKATTRFTIPVERTIRIPGGKTEEHSNK
jgi:hypothetical protein